MKRVTLIQTLIIIGLIVTLLVMRGCYIGEMKEINNAHETELMKERMEKQVLQQIVNKQGDTINLQKAEVTANQEVIRRISDEKFDLQKKNDRLTKRVQFLSTQTTETKLDSVPVPFVDTVQRKKFADSLEAKCKAVIDYYENEYIKVPRIAKVTTDHYSADLTANKQGITINSLVVPDSNYLRVIEKKGGFFRKAPITTKKGVTKIRLKFHVPKSIEVQTLHTNPNVHVTGQTSLIYVPKKKGRWVGPALGIAAGLFLGSKL